MAYPSMSWMLLFCLMALSYLIQGKDFHSELLPPRISCPQGSMSCSSHCYALYLRPKSWIDAETDCQKWPLGHLVSVLSGSEASFVASFISNSLSKNIYMWIGLHDPTEGQQLNGGGWEWSSTDKLDYRAWERTTRLGPHPGYCGTVTKNSGFKRWSDFDCDSELPYVCKFTD